MKNRKVLLRFDDICPTMDWQQWGKAKCLLDSIGATALLGVIPDCKDPDLFINDAREDFWEYIRELQKRGYTIAMHGYQHVFDINAKGLVTQKHHKKNHSEFAGHSYDVQFNKIKAGRDILLQHGVETDVFFAPAHAYDTNTLKALAANGFHYLSDGKSCKPFVRHGIICVPVLSSGISKMRIGKYHTAVLHAHEWVRPDKKDAWTKLQSLCKNQEVDIISFNDYIKRDLGNPTLQILSESLYLIWERYMKPNLVRFR